jgi:GNAT superfamily N-acetyltransferase
MSRTLVGQSPASRSLAAQHAASAGLLRQAVPDQDAAAIRDFVCRLSPRSQYLRFFAAVAPPSSGLLRALSGAAVISRAPGAAPQAGPVDVLLVIDDAGSVIAHGMAADELAPAGLASSIGLMVADAYQRRGIGAMVLNALVGRAASRGVGSLIFEVLPANRVMRGIIGRRWPDVAGERTPDAIVFRPAIAPRLSQTAWPVPSLVDLGRNCQQGDPHARPPHAA